MIRFGRRKNQEKANKSEQTTKPKTITKRIGQNTSGKQRPQLNFVEMFSIVSVLNTPLMLYASSYNHSMKHGAMFFLGLNIIFLIICSMPVFMISTFFGIYARKSYIVFWDMVPIFKGVGFTVALYLATTELIHVASASISFMFIVSMIPNGVYWTQCKFDGATSECVPAGKSWNFTGHCCSVKMTENCSDNWLRFSTLEFLRHNILKEQKNISLLGAFTNLNWKLIIITSVIWVIIYVFTIQGVRKFKKLVSCIILAIYALHYIPQFIYSFFSAGNYGAPALMTSTVTDLVNFEFWARGVKNVMNIQVPGSFVTFGSYAKPGILPDVMALAIFGFKIFCTMMSINTGAVIISKMEKNYGIQGDNCIKINGYEFMLAPIIDVLSQMPAGGFFVALWSLNITLWGMLSAIFTITCIIDALVDAFPRYKNYRIYVCSIVCLCCLVINISILNPLYYTITYIWVYTGMYLVNVTILGVYFLSIFIYSTENVKDDYHFLYGYTLNQAWITGFKMCCLVCMCGFLVLRMQDVQLKYKDLRRDDVHLMVYITVGVVLLPIPSYMVYLIVQKQFKGNFITLFQSHPNWGPPDPQQKLDRKQFDSLRATRYRSQKRKCEHTCLLNSPKLVEEIENVDRNRQKLLNNIDESGELRAIFSKNVNV